VRIPYLGGVLDRDLAALERSISAYPDDATLWVLPGGLANSGGTLALHLVGNLEYLIGAVLGRTGYVRDRAAEFAIRGLSRRDLVEKVRRVRAIVGQVLPTLTNQDFDREYPIVVVGCRLATGDFLLHLVAHLGYHLGQLDYHRRVVSGDPSTVGAMAIPELVSARPEA
jgi:DinB family protein